MQEPQIPPRQVREPRPQRVRRADPPPSDGSIRVWQTLAIVALIAATAGWTTVAVMVVNDRPSTAAVETPTESLDPDLGGNASAEPIAESHEVVALESLLPTEVNGTTLSTQSWTGATILADDAWSVAMTTFLTSAGKTAADLQAGQAYDPTGTLELTAGVFRADGVAASDLQAQMIKAWQGDYPDLKVSQVTLGSREVTKGDFGTGAINSYWFVRDDLVFDVGTSDEKLAEAVIAAIPDPSAPAGSPRASSSTAPASSGSPAPSGSPVPSPS